MLRKESQGMLNSRLTPSHESMNIQWHVSNNYKNFSHFIIHCIEIVKTLSLTGIVGGAFQSMSMNGWYITGCGLSFFTPRLIPCLFCQFWGFSNLTQDLISRLIPRESKKLYPYLMHYKIENKCPILEIWLVPERKFSNLNCALLFFDLYFDLTELHEFQFQFLSQKFSQVSWNYS